VLLICPGAASLSLRTVIVLYDDKYVSCKRYKEFLGMVNESITDFFHSRNLTKTFRILPHQTLIYNLALYGCP
jgi:hypothetical protein